jgi:hypothetical protein
LKFKNETRRDNDGSLSSDLPHLQGPHHSADLAPPLPKKEAASRHDFIQCELDPEMARRIRSSFANQFIVEPQVLYRDCFEGKALGAIN